MSKLEEKRQFPRYAIKLPVLYRRKAPPPMKTGTGWTHDLSEGGACLELTDRLEASSVLELLFQTEHGSLEFTAAVMWAATMRQKGEGILHGVAFTELGPRQREALRELIQPKG